MFRSLRVRLPLLFLTGNVIAMLVTTAIAVQLFREFARDQALSGLRSSANGIAELYSNAIKADYAARTRSQSQRAPSWLVRAQLEKMTGDRIYYVGVTPFPGEKSGLRPLPIKIDWPSGETLTFDFVPPGQHRTYLAVAQPVVLHNRGRPIGAIIVARPKTSINHSVYLLVERL